MSWRRTFTITFLTGTLFVAGIAFAEWLAQGTGTGTAKAGTAEPLTVTGGTPVQLLYPGGTGDVALRITNPNPYAVTVTAIEGDGTIVADATHETAGCTSDVHGVTYTDQSGSWLVPASGHLDVVLQGAVAMSTASADACQGAVFTIPLSVTGGSADGAGDPSPEPEPVSCTDDLLEDNDTFATRRNLGFVGFGSPTVHNLNSCPDDEDFFQFTSQESSTSTCFPGETQHYLANVAVTVSGASGQVTLKFYDSTGGTPFYSVAIPAGQSRSESIAWSGSCGAEDTQAFYLSIDDDGTEHAYQLSLSNSSS